MEGSAGTKLGRRALLAAGAAGVAAAAAEAIAAPAKVQAGNGMPLTVGVPNTGSSETGLQVSAGNGLAVSSDGGDGLRGSSSVGAKSGVYGFSQHADGYGVYGANIPSGAFGHLGAKGQGVKGFAAAGEGVRGESNTNNGVAGKSGGNARAGVFGQTTNTQGYGVEGRNMATNTHGFLGGVTYGVYGASPAAGAAAVMGEHSDPLGTAIRGLNTALNTEGHLGYGATAIYAYAPTDLSHAGLHIAGRALFDRSGLLTIAKNTSSLSISETALSAHTMVLATLQTNRAGVYIQAAVVSPASGKITIYLNKKVNADTKVAYFIIG